MRLAEAGVELAIGDMDDRESLDAAMRGVYGAFTVQPGSDTNSGNLRSTQLSPSLRNNGMISSRNAAGFQPEDHQILA
jgi:uncharacterized protein YbjT (DUF2867 family)